MNISFEFSAAMILISNYSNSTQLNWMLPNNIYNQ